MLNGKRVLVVESEFLIALDMQRVLEEAQACETVFARSIEEAAHLEHRFPEYDLAVVEMPSQDKSALALARALMTARVAVVATTATSPDIPLDMPTVIKPFDDASLLTACMAALAASPK